MGMKVELKEEGYYDNFHLTQVYKILFILQGVQFDAFMKMNEILHENWKSRNFVPTYHCPLILY